jgi:hypothetical protein
VKDLGNAQYEVVAGLAHGMGLGVWDTSTQLICLNTFLDHGCLGTDQQQLAELLDFKRELNEYPAGFRAHVERLLEEDRKKAA